MDVLQKTTSGLAIDASNTEDRLEGAAEEKLVSFCEQVLKETSELQSTLGETTNMDVHRVLELRSPVIVKVIHLNCFTFVTETIKSLIERIIFLCHLVPGFGRHVLHEQHNIQEAHERVLPSAHETCLL